MTLNISSILIYLLMCIRAGSLQQVNVDDTYGIPFHPKTKHFEVKSGSSINFTCYGARDNVSWEFKSCGLNYRGIYCARDDVDHNREGSNSWNVLHFNDGKKVLKIENVKLEDIGIYRCVSGNIIRKIFFLEIDVADYEWPPPEVISMATNNNVIHVNSYLTINCSVSSKSPPNILWFKECWSNACEIDLKPYNIVMTAEHNCLCLISDASSYNRGNLYISKLHIFKTRIWDGGTYVCSALSADGKDYKSVTVVIEEYSSDRNTKSQTSYLILLFISLVLILLYIVSYLFCTSKRKKRDSSKHLDHLISQTQVISNK